MIDYKKQGKRNMQRGREFERKVRADLEKEGYIVSKWQNNIEFTVSDNKVIGKFIPAKQGRFRRTSTGFPDFVCLKKPTIFDDLYALIFVECKSGKYLTREEKEKVKWMETEHNIKTIIAYKGKKRGEIIYGKI